MKNYIFYIGFIAGLLTMSAGIPQIYHVYETDNTDGINILFAVTYMVGLYLWTLYGYLLRKPTLLWFNLIGALCWTYISYKVVKHMMV